MINDIVYVPAPFLRLRDGTGVFMPAGIPQQRKM